MKHPNQATLALHAGGDLGFFARWRTERHLRQCDRCRDEVDAFAATREIIPELAEIPEIPWNRLAAEMRANIRLGLEAGECVRAGDPPLRETPLFTGARAVVAMASMVGAPGDRHRAGTSRADPHHGGRPTMAWWCRPPATEFRSERAARRCG